MTEFADLLHATPKLSVNRAALQEALNQAFYMGKPEAALHEALPGVDPNSTWRPDLFKNDLFLRDLIQKFFKIEIDDKDYSVNTDSMIQLVTHPPTDPDTIRFRQDISRELAENEALYTHICQLYRALHEMVEMFNTSLYSGTYTLLRSDMSDWRMCIFRQILRVIHLMTEKSGPMHAQSGLKRIHEFGTEIVGSESYRRLCSLVDYDENMLGLTMNLRVGADGYLRDFKVLNTSENVGNEHYRPPVNRFFAKIALVLRGYKFSDTELVGKVIDAVYKDLEPWLVPFLQLFGQLEFYLAGQGFRLNMKEMGYASALPEFISDSDVKVRGSELYNPLLFLQGVKPTPCDLDTPGQTLAIITGPNSGGKTRFLQAVAIAQVVSQAGLYAPLSNARFHIMHGMFVSLVEEGKVDHEEGRLGMELLRVRTMFENVGPRSMIVLDELCSGTNPSEGIEIFQLVLNLLEKLSPNAFITTHFLEFARELRQNPAFQSLVFRQVELDAQENPTYNFTGGVALTSLAKRIARKLGVTLEELDGLIEDQRKSFRNGRKISRVA